MQNVTVAVRDWGQALMTSLTNALALFFAAIPRLIGFALILIVGWFIASLLARAVAALLRAVRFNELAQRSGLSDFVHKMGVQTDAAGALAGVAKWFVRLIALVVAFDALGLPAVSDVLRRLLLWLPNLAVALVVLVIGGLVAGALGRLVRGAASEGGLTNPDALAGVAKVAVWGFAIIVAVNQIGVADTLVNTLFMGFVAMLALAGGLAFGLGGRDVASRIWESWYGQAQQAGPKLRRTAEAGRQRAERGWEQMPARGVMRADEPPRAE
jgi:Conserved TM helix